MLFDEIADDFRNAAAGFWTNDEELYDGLVSWLQHRSQEKLEQMGLSFVSIKRDVKWWFHEKPNSVYGRPQEVVRSSTLSQAQLARRYGVNRSTVHRWLKSEKENKPSFEMFAVVSTAENLKYPRGHFIAMMACHTAFEKLLASMDMGDVTPPSQAELLCLYCYHYSRMWWVALVEQDEEGIREATDVIQAVMEKQFRAEGDWGAATFDRLLKQWWIQWYTLTAALPYEWF